MSAHTPGPWRWQRAENGEGEDELTLVGSPDDWQKCEYFCFGWKEGSPRSRGPLSTPGHEHNHAPTVLCATGWHGSGDLVIEPDSPDAHLIAAAPDLLTALKSVVAVASRDTNEFSHARAAIAKAEGRS